MDKLTSILVIADHSAGDRPLVARAVELARRFGAVIELFMCDWEHGASLPLTYDTAGVEKQWLEYVWAGREYLEALRESVPSADVTVFADCSCESPLERAIAKKIASCHPDLVIKSASKAQPGRRFALDAADWKLMQTCPASLMLVRGRPWHAQPRFAALVDMRDPETPSAAKEVLHTAEYLSVGCGASLDAVYCEREPSAVDCGACVEALRSLAREHRIPAERIHVLAGDPDEKLPAFASRSDYDLLALGVLTHRRRLANWMGNLTGRIADLLDCDLVLVKEPTVAETIRVRDADVLWQGAAGL